MLKSLCRMSILYLFIAFHIIIIKRFLFLEIIEEYNNSKVESVYLPKTKIKNFCSSHVGYNELCYGK